LFEPNEERSIEPFQFPTRYPGDPIDLTLPTGSVYVPPPLLSYFPLVTPPVPVTLGIPSTSFLPSNMAATNIREVKIRTPSDFLGDPEQAQKYLQDCELYLEVNDQIYDTDKKRIIFALSFLTGGPAASWKRSFINEVCKRNPVSYGTWAEFSKRILETFEPIDDKGTARTQMKNLKQGSSGVQDYISQFRILQERSGLTDNESLIEYFMDGIHPELLKKVYGMEIVPDTLEGWMKAVSKWEGQHKRAQAIIKNFRATSSPAASTSNPTFIPTPVRDPNAMDIDRLSAAERAEHMRQGKCFVCHQTGHCASAHKKGGLTPPRNKQGQFVPQKKYGANAATKIRAILGELDDEEKEIAVHDMVDAGF
jgi:Retrotransposon gag protein